jgi:hypothetical protein
MTTHGRLVAGVPFIRCAPAANATGLVRTLFTSKGGGSHPNPGTEHIPQMIFVLFDGLKLGRRVKS